MTYLHTIPTGIPQANVSNLPTDLSAKAANTEAFVTIGTTAGLTGERALTAGSGISITDGGAGSTVTIAATGGGGGGGGGNGGTATLSFGATGSTSASVTVTGQAWVTGSNAIACTVVDDARAEDAAIEGLTLVVAHQVVGDGFDIIGAPAIGDFVGDVTVAFVGV